MAKQTVFGMERESPVAADKTLISEQGLVERMKNVISTNIGLCEIRMNLFLWELFRPARQKEN